MKEAKPNARLTAKEKYDLLVEIISNKEINCYKELETYKVAFGESSEETKCQRARWNVYYNLLEDIRALES